MLTFALLAANPFGGLAVAIPYATFALHRPAGLAWLVGQPLAYLQVLVIDLGWTQLRRLRRWVAFLERRRSPRLERLVASRGAFWLTALVSPFAGPWLCMALFRYANVPHRKVAAPLLLGIAWTSSLIALACAYAPHLLRR
jgi:hypothetical protein